MFYKKLEGSETFHFTSPETKTSIQYNLSLWAVRERRCNLTFKRLSPPPPSGLTSDNVSLWNVGLQRHSDTADWLRRLHCFWSPWKLSKLHWRDLKAMRNNWYRLQTHLTDVPNKILIYYSDQVFNYFNNYFLQIL